jgi:hypothetical protein
MEPANKKARVTTLSPAVKAVAAADEATENFAEVMNRALADAAKAEAERDVLAARVAALEAQLRARDSGYPCVTQEEAILEKEPERRPGIARWKFYTKYSCSFTVDLPANIDLTPSDAFYEFDTSRGMLYYKHADDDTWYETKMTRTVGINHCLDSDIELVDYQEWDMDSWRHGNSRVPLA